MNKKLQYCQQIQRWSFQFELQNSDSPEDLERSIGHDNCDRCEPQV